MSASELMDSEIKAISKLSIPHLKNKHPHQNPLSHRAKSKNKKDKSVISNFLINPEKLDTLQLTNKYSSKTLLENNLPSISTRSKSLKKSSFLEMWIDEALDPHENGQENNKKLEVEQGPLKTIRKFEIDKKYLKSQNISSEIIDKLYNSLYVYTYGINHTFEEILSLTKMQDHVDSRIINNFWKAFIKLLEGCTSYRTVFQVVEANHLKNMNEMRDARIKREEQFLLQQEKHEMDISKLTKKINEQSYALSKLQNDYNISEATLQLTDQAFNEQVHLRLKFQEKVNAMFSSYQQIRNKYQKLLNDLNLKKDFESARDKMEIVLKAKLEKYKASNHELQKELKREKERLLERERQIEIKRQEVVDLNQILREKKQREQRDQQQLSQLISKSKNYKYKLEEVESSLKANGTLISDFEVKLRDQKDIISNCRMSNTEIYFKFQQMGRKIGQFEELKLELQSEIQQLKAQNTIYSQKNEELQLQMNEISFKNESLNDELELCHGQIQIKNNLIQRNTELIDNLKAVKEKYQRLYDIASKQKKNLQDSTNTANQQLQMAAEEREGMKMLLDSRNKQLQQANSKMENQREVFRSKISSLKEQIAFKQNQVLQFQNKLEEGQFLVQETNNKMNDANKEIEKMINDKLIRESQILNLKLKIEEYEVQRLTNRKLIQQLNDKIQSLTKQKIQVLEDLGRKRFVLDKIKDDANLENISLRKYLQGYRENVDKRISYIHPMIYEDCRGQIEKLNERVSNLLELLKHKEEINNDLQQQLLDRQSKISDLQEEIQNFKQAIQLKEKWANSKMQQLQEYYKLKLNISKLQVQLEHNQRQLCNERSQLQSCKNRLNDTSQILQKKESELQEMTTSNSQFANANLQYKNENNRLRNKLSELKEQMMIQQRDIGRLKEELNNKINEIRQIRATPHNTHQSLASKQSQRENETRRREREKQRQMDSRLNKKQREKDVVCAEVQTDKTKFIHGSKFELATADYGSQVCTEEIFDELQKFQQSKSPSEKRLGHMQREGRKIEGKEFKRALKMTYMRR